MPPRDRLWEPFGIFSSAVLSWVYMTMSVGLQNKISLHTYHIGWLPLKTWHPLPKHFHSSSFQKALPVFSVSSGPLHTLSVLPGARLSLFFGRVTPCISQDMLCLDAAALWCAHSPCPHTSLDCPPCVCLGARLASSPDCELREGGTLPYPVSPVAHSGHAINVCEEKL